jgi:hypothetical protein
MDPITIAALVAAVAGAGIQYKASSDAQERQRREIAASLQAQRELQMQAEKKAMDAASGYETPKRAAEQEQLAADIEQSLIQPVSESQAIRAQQQTTQGDVSGDYATAKAAADLETMKQAEQLARLLGKTTSASRLRMNEGIRLMDTGQAVDQLAGFSRGRQGADNIAIQQAGLVDPGQVFLGSLLQSAGSAGLMAGGGSAAASGTGLKATAGEGMNLFAPSGGMGLKMTGGSGIGLKAPGGLRILGGM